jgi:hypothetical protein
MSPKKRQRLLGDIVVRSALDTGSAVSSVVASFSQHAQLACSDRTHRQDAHNLLYELPRTSTPFGTLCEESKLRGPKADLSIYHVNPPAFLFQAASRTTLAYSVRDWFNQLARENTFAPVHFIGTQIYAVVAPPISLEAYGIATISQWCHSIRTPLGVLSRKDLVQYQSVGGGIGLGFILGFAKLIQRDGAILFVAVISVCTSVGTHSGIEHWKDQGYHGILVVEHIRSVVPYRDFGQTFAPAYRLQ